MYARNTYKIQLYRAPVDRTYRYVDLNHDENLGDLVFEQTLNSTPPLDRPVRLNADIVEIADANYLVVTREESPDDSLFETSDAMDSGMAFSAFIDDFQYVNAGVTNVLFTVDWLYPYLETATSDLDVDDMIVERSNLSPYDKRTQMLYERSDPMFTQFTPTKLSQTHSIKFDDYDIIVYTPKQKDAVGSAPSLEYTKGNINDPNFYDSLVSSDTSDSSLGINPLEITNGEFNESTVTGSQKIPLTNQYEIKIYPTLADLFVDSSLWNAKGTNILKAELRPKIEGVDWSGFVKKDYKIPITIKNDLDAINSTVEVSVGGSSIEIDPLMLKNDTLELTLYDSGLPNAKSFWTVTNAYNGTQSNIASRYTITNSQSRNIDLFANSSTSYLFANRNALNQRINNFIRSKKIGILTAIKEYNNAVYKMKLRYDMDKHITDYSNDTTKENALLDFDNSMSIQRNNYSRNYDNLLTTQSMQKNQFDKQQSLTISNMERSNKGAKYTLSNQFNTQLNVQDINFSTNFLKEIVGTVTSLPEGLGALIIAGLRMIANSAVSYEQAEAVLNAQYLGKTGDSWKDESGSVNALKYQYENITKPTTEANNKLALSGFLVNQQIAKNGAILGNTNAVENMKANYQNSLSKIENNFKLQNRRLLSNYKISYANLNLDTNISLWNKFASIEVETENFIGSIEAEFNDNISGMSAVSSGDGRTSFGQNRFDLFVNIYTPQTFETQQNEVTIKKYGYFINNFASLYKKDSLNDIIQSEGLHYIQFNDFRMMEGANPRTIEILNDIFNNGVFIERSPSVDE